jgi:hypothetical protein
MPLAEHGSPWQYETAPNPEAEPPGGHDRTKGRYFRMSHRTSDPPKKKRYPAIEARMIIR